MTDYVSLEAIKTFDYEAYERIYQEVTITTRKAIWNSTSFDDTKISTFENATTQSLLKYLFINQGSYGKNSLNEKRLKDPEFFQRYFSLSISSTDITEENLRHFFTVGSDKNQLLQEILQSGRMENFLRRLIDADLGKHYQVNNLVLFHDFLRFWETREDLITSELDEYIWNSYFNLAHSFEDKFAGARTALRELILDPNSTIQPMKFVFNHFIHLMKSNDRNDTQFYGQVYDQSEIMFEELQRTFLEYLILHHKNYFSRACSENPSWVTNLFIYSFAKFCPDKYLLVVDRYFSNANFLAFFIKSYFLMGFGDVKTLRIKFDARAIFFPSNLLDVFITSLTNLKKGSLNNENQVYVNLFLKEIEENN